MYFDTVGELVYLDDWWLGLTLDYEIGKYFRKLFQFATYNVMKLGRPSWHEHVVIARGETINPSCINYWKRYDRAKIDLRIFHEVYTNGNAFWLPVYCEAGYVLREQLDLKRKPPIPFHFCIGYLAEGKLGDRNTCEKV